LLSFEDGTVPPRLARTHRPVVAGFESERPAAQDEPMGRHPSLEHPPLGFAHRGGRSHAPENTLDAFALALRLGATGLETDAWVTADGVAVLDHDGLIGRRPRRRPIIEVDRSELPDHIPTVGDLVPLLTEGVALSVDVKDPRAAEPLVTELGRDDPTRIGRVWLCHDDHDLLAAWREHFPQVHLVDSTRLKRLDRGPERHAARLRELKIDAVNLHHTDWTAGLVALYHRFGVRAWGWDAQHRRILDGLLDMGIDAVFSDHVDRMVDALKRINVPSEG
jgi:glycerophosphoryl diester phosphodiesterase